MSNSSPPRAPALRPVGQATFPTPWPWSANPPQRYLGNYGLYLARGGPVRLEEDVRGFVADGANGGDMARFWFFCMIFDQIVKEGLAGNVAELGVYKGNTASFLATIARHLDSTAYLLDTFEGFQAADLRGLDQNQQVQFADTSLDHVRARVGDDHVRFVKGHFPASASQIPADAAFCLVHIDCDLQAPIASALSYFYPRLVPGGFLIVHDYGSLAWAGAERAVDEFLADKPEAAIPVPDGCGSIVIRKARSGGRQSNWLSRKRCALFGREWAEAGDDHLRPLLGAGWSGAEKWGVWGIGQSHELFLHLSSMPSNDIIFEAEVQVPLIVAGQTRSVEVGTDGWSLDTWRFTSDDARGIRTVRIPASAFRATAGDPAVARLEFRPSHVVVPQEVTGTSGDTRALGMGVLRIRRGHAD